MPRIADALTRTIIYLYQTIEDAENGTPSGGTGFLVGVPYEQKFNDRNRYHTYLVTNEHVIGSNVKAGRINQIDGQAIGFPIEGDEWTFHPDGDDLGVIPVVMDKSICDHTFLPSEMFIDKNFIDEHDIGLGDEVFIIGRFQYHEGRKRNYPSARFGNLAQMPNEPIRVKRAANYTALQEAFLVEMRSIGGYSGSPAFIYIPPYTHRMTKTPRGVSPTFYVRLLGIDFGHLSTKDPIKNNDNNKIDGWHVEGNSAMTGVIPAWKLMELLNIDKLKKQRAEAEELYAQQQPKEDTPNMVLDTISVGEDNETPLSKEEFEAALRKATRPNQQ